MFPIAFFNELIWIDKFISPPRIFLPTATLFIRISLFEFRLFPVNCLFALLNQPLLLCFQLHIALRFGNELPDGGFYFHCSTSCCLQISASCSKALVMQLA